jgi:hypothetical protein
LADDGHLADVFADGAPGHLPRRLTVVPDQNPDLAGDHDVHLVAGLTLLGDHLAVGIGVLGGDLGDVLEVLG